MKNFTLLFTLVSFFMVSCGSTMPQIFGKKTPHEKYEEKLKDTGVANTPQGKMWLAASETALSQPQEISVPYKLQGYFHSDKARALGLHFHAKQGEQIIFQLNRDPGFVLYADVFQVEGTGTSHLMTVENDQSAFSFQVKETGNYIIRLQPQLDAAGKYNLAVTSAPSFGFPVAGNKARVGSFWGASRDGGKRSHEGIDIFAPKRTQVIASADGYISSVRDGGLGGKTVNLRPVGSHYSLYYAHLDEQLVNEGQFVKKGEVIGLVGNTGNARTTPPHLHFGIYTNSGAVDPFPFVNNAVRNPPVVQEKDIASSSLKLIKSHRTMTGESLKVNTVLLPLAVTPKGYIAESAEGRQVMTPFSSVKLVRKIVVSKT